MMMTLGLPFSLVFVIYFSIGQREDSNGDPIESCLLSKQGS